MMVPFFVSLVSDAHEDDARGYDLGGLQFVEETRQQNVRTKQVKMKAIHYICECNELF